MTKLGMLFTALALVGLTAAQVRADSNFKLALPDHPGQLRWSAEGFRIIQSSAKPKGNEIGIRGRDETGRLTFLVFLFLVPEQAPLTSAKCRDGALQPEKKDNPTLKIIGTSEKARPGTLPVSVVTYTVRTLVVGRYTSYAGSWRPGTCVAIWSFTVTPQSALKMRT